MKFSRYPWDLDAAWKRQEFRQVCHQMRSQQNGVVRKWLGKPLIEFRPTCITSPLPKPGSLLWHDLSDDSLKLVNDGQYRLLVQNYSDSRWTTVGDPRVKPRIVLREPKASE